MHHGLEGYNELQGIQHAMWDVALQHMCTHAIALISDSSL